MVFFFLLLFFFTVAEASHKSTSAVERTDRTHPKPHVYLISIQIQILFMNKYSLDLNKAFAWF